MAHDAPQATGPGRLVIRNIGLMLSGGFLATAFVLHLAGLALVRAVQPLRYARSFALRQAVLRVARPGNQTRVILLAVGLGCFFILGVRSLQANLLRDVFGSGRAIACMDLTDDGMVRHPSFKGLKP